MTFCRPRRRPRGESIVPMVNVVFLLLIFFLMTATITTPEPFEVLPPTSDTDSPAKLEQPLFVARDGRLAWGAFRGADVLPAIAAVRVRSADPPPLAIRAHRQVDAARIAGLLADLAARGVTTSQLIAEPAE